MRLINNVQSTQIEKPKEVTVDVDTVYLRNNIVAIDEEEFKGWQYDETQYELREYIAFIGELEKRQDTTDPLVERIKTATEIYEENKDKTDILLADLKVLKIEKLKEQCSEAIYAGFIYQDMRFGFNEHDQQNWTQQLLLVVAGQVEPIQWKTKNKGVIELTSQQFSAIANEAKNHKMNEQAKYWGLEQQVVAVETAEQVKAITW